jgi:hypothetical protein
VSGFELRLKQSEHVVDVRRSPEVGGDHVRVIALPVTRPIDLGVADQLGSVPVVDWHGQPAQTLGRLDPVAIPPVALRELQVVVHDEQVDVVDEIEVAPPRQVIRLNDADSHPSVRRLATKNLRVSCWQRSYLPLLMTWSSMAASTPG